MTRLLNLIKNEYIKLLKRLSTIAMIIIMFLLSLAVLGITRIAENIEIEMYEAEESTVAPGNSEKYLVYIEKHKEEIKKLEASVLENDLDKERIEKEIEYKKKYIEYLQFLYDNNINSNEDWRFMIVASIMLNEEAYGDENAEKELLDCIVNNDFEKYLVYMAKVTEGETIKFNEKESQIGNVYKYMLDNDITDPDDFRVDLLELINESSEKTLSDREVKGLRAKEYQVINNIEYATNSSQTADSMMYGDDNKSTAFMDAFGSSYSVMSILNMIIMVFAGIIVATEFTAGTIKFLVTNPVSRGKIIVSKYLTIVSLALIGTIALYVFNVATAAIFFGTEGMSASHLIVSEETIREIPFVLNIGCKYALELVGVITYATMSFAISSFAKSTALAVAVGIMCSMIGSTVTTFLAALGQDWGRYLVFANTDLSGIMEGTSMFPNHSLTFAIANVLVYVVIFFVMAYDGFTRKEV